MDKINFINGTSPYLNAQNLNQMQTNIENDINEKNYFSTGTEINSGDDLNNYTDFGVFTSKNATISGSLINTPVTNVGFRMEVFPITAAERLVQKIYCNNNAGTQYFRVYSSNGWQPWRTYTTTVVE